MQPMRWTVLIRCEGAGQDGELRDVGCFVRPVDRAAPADFAARFFGISKALSPKIRSGHRTSIVAVVGTVVKCSNSDSLRSTAPPW